MDKFKKKYDLMISIASPEDIRGCSYGEVQNMEALSYRTHKPILNGLFCESIFGPVKDYQCSCGITIKFFEGHICERCGVEYTSSEVRRERMGHIELEAPVVNACFLGNDSSILSLLLDMSTRDICDIMNYRAYVIVDTNGVVGIKNNQVVREWEYNDLWRKYGYSKIKVMSGAEAIKKLLVEYDLEENAKKLREEIKNDLNQDNKRKINRLNVIEAFLNSDNKPEWMVLDVIPVIPPDLRPFTILDDGQIMIAKINALYREIINHNNRLKKFKYSYAPDMIIMNEKKALQAAVNKLMSSTIIYDRGSFVDNLVGFFKNDMKSSLTNKGFYVETNTGKKQYIISDKETENYLYNIIFSNEAYSLCVENDIIPQSLIEFVKRLQGYCFKVTLIDWSIQTDISNMSFVTD